MEREEFEGRLQDLGFKKNVLSSTTKSDVFILKRLGSKFPMEKSFSLEVKSKGKTGECGFWYKRRGFLTKEQVKQEGLKYSDRNWIAYNYLELDYKNAYRFICDILTHHKYTFSPEFMLGDYKVKYPE